MSRTAKVIIVVGVTLVLLISAGVAIGVYWLSHRGREFIESTKKGVEQGIEFGQKTDERGCLTEAISRYKRNRGFSSAMTTAIFLRGCLDTSRPTPGFCDQVPGPTEIFKGAQWQMKQCEDAGITDSYCGQIFAQVQQYCREKQFKPKASTRKEPIVNQSP